MMMSSIAHRFIASLIAAVTIAIAGCAQAADTRFEIPKKETPGGYSGQELLQREPVSKTPYAYLAEGLTTEGYVRIRPNILPVSEELAGKQYVFVDGDRAEDLKKVGGNMVRFIDGKRIMFYLGEPVPGATPTYANYISFKVAPGVFFVTFIEQRGKWREQQLVSFILDQNRMGYTDSFMEDDLGHGELYWMLVQGALIEVKSNDPRYFQFK